MNKSIKLIVIILTVNLGLFAQGLSVDKQLVLNHSVDSLVDNYEKYSCFTANTTSFSEKYVSALFGLFEQKEKTIVPNDLPIFPSKQTFTLENYASAVKTQMPTGLDVMIRNLRKEDPVFNDNYVYVTILFDKNILGVYQNNQRFDQIVPMKGVIQLTSDCKSGKFQSLERISSETKPSMPGNISGRTDVNAGELGVFYSIEAQKDARFYNWKLPHGWKGKSLMNTIFVDLEASAQSGDIQVISVNDKGESEASSLYVEVNGTEKEVIAANSKNAGISLAGDLEIMYASGSGMFTKISPSFGGRAWVFFKIQDLKGNLSLNAKTGLGDVFYHFKVQNADLSNRKVYLNTIEFPIMLGIEKFFGQSFSASLFSGTNVIYPLNKTKTLKSPTPVGWISDLNLSYNFKFLNKYTSLYVGGRYNQMFGVKTDGKSADIGALGVYAGLKIDTRLIQNMLIKTNK